MGAFLKSLVLEMQESLDETPLTLSYASLSGEPCSLPRGDLPCFLAVIPASGCQQGASCTVPHFSVSLASLH